MLRPTVAVTNCARAGETSCLDIGPGACAGPNLIRMQLICPPGPNKLPKRGQNVNEARKTASSHGPAVGQLVRSNCRAKSDGGDFLARDQIESRAKHRFLPVYKKPSRAL